MRDGKTCISRRPETFALPDGRLLGYAASGDPTAPPVFYFHGWPASRLEADLVPDLPARVLGIDRPGYGASSAQAGRRLSDWPADVAALAAHLGIGSFHVVGVSGGAPYALACAARLSMVRGVALVSPLPPLVGATSEALGRELVRLRLLGRHPILGGALLRLVRLAVGMSLLDLGRLLESAAAPRDLEILTPFMRGALIAAWREGLRPGVAGAISDARIYASPWGFDLGDIAVPVAIWHGTDDRVVPAGTTAGFAALPNGKTHLVAGEGHYSLALNHAGTVLNALLG